MTQNDPAERPPGDGDKAAEKRKRRSEYMRWWRKRKSTIIKEEPLEINEDKLGSECKTTSIQEGLSAASQPLNEDVDADFGKIRNRQNSREYLRMRRKLKKADKCNTAVSFFPDKQTSNVDVPSKRKNLKKNAVPSVNLPKTKLDKKLEATKALREEQAQKRRSRYACRENQKDMTVGTVLEIGDQFQRESLVSNNVVENNVNVHIEDAIVCEIEVLSNNKISDDNVNLKELNRETEIMTETMNRKSEWGDILAEHQYVMLSKTRSVEVQVEPEIVKRDVAVQANSVWDVRSRLSVINNIRTDQELNTCTGIPTFHILDAIEKSLELIMKSEVEHTMKSNSLLPIRDKVILTFMKLKQDLSFKFIGILFDVAPATCKNYYEEMLPVLAAVLRSAVPWPSREEIQRNIPLCFMDYKDTRIILDCTEVFLQKTKCLNCRISSYSFYKGHETFKVLVGIAPSGMIIFISNSYGGRASDKAICNQSNVIPTLKLGVEGAIMADKGFLLDIECLKNKVKLYRPPFLRNKDQFDLESSERTYGIAAARVHVERSIQRLKVFKILQGKYSFQRLHDVDNIMTIIAGLVNLSRPILADNKFIGNASLKVNK